MRILLLVFFLVASAYGENPVLTALEAQKDLRAPALVKLLQPRVGADFTLAFDSASQQGARRGLMLVDRGDVILAVPASGGSLEMVTDTEGDVRPHALELAGTNQRKAFHHDGKPTSCKQCHGDPFTFIWSEYDNDAKEKTWKGFLGEVDDRVDPTTEGFQSLKKEANFASLFPEKIPREAYPYWQLHEITAEEKKKEDEAGIRPGGGVFNEQDLPKPPEGKFFSSRDRKFENSPNERFDVFLPARAGRSVARRARLTHPDRYAKFKLALFRYAIGCRQRDGSEDSEKAKALEWAALRAAFKRDNPGVYAEWEAIEKAYDPKSSNRSAAQVLYPLMLLNYLGVAPESILLTTPLKDERRITSSPEKFFEFLAGYRSGSPLEYNANGMVLVNYIPAHLKEIDVPDFDKLTKLEPNYYLPEEPLLKTLELAYRPGEPFACTKFASASLVQYAAPKPAAAPAPPKEPGH